MRKGNKTLSSLKAQMQDQISIYSGYLLILKILIKSQPYAKDLAMNNIDLASFSPIVSSPAEETVLSKDHKVFSSLLLKIMAGG